MTEAQLRGLLIKESLFYTICAFILALPCELLVTFLLASADFGWIKITPLSILLPYLILLPIFAVLCYIVPSVIYEKNKSKSIMDEFRETY